jgi:ferric-dicitrate binding protein FerR (iron transport regulator)
MEYFHERYNLQNKMNNSQNYNRIVRLISKEISDDLLPDERQELLAWLNEHPENTALYIRIKKSENFRSRNDEYQQIDVQAGWGILNSKIARTNKVIKLKRIFAYAAAILIPLMIFGGIMGYLSNQKSEVTIVAHVPVEILPGKSRAILVLDDGQSVLLDSLTEQSITEKDGTMIEKGNQSLNYSKQSDNLNAANIYNTIKIPQGGEYNLILSDGTKVYLNAESQLRYPVQFAGNVREVELVGEGYFEVATNAQKPFIVKTKGVSVEVLGTSFNVNAYGNTEKIVTTLVEGSVKLNMQGSSASQILEPAEQAVFDVNNGKTEVRKVDVNLYTAWKDGNLIFYDNRLEDIMIILKRWYSAEVEFKSATIKELRFSGSLDRYGDIRQILDIIKSTGKVNIEIKENTILFSE